MGVENFYNIDKTKHYFAQMHPYDAIIPMMGIALVNGNESNWVECEIVEDRYKVEDGYKVTLKPLNPNYSSYHFYQCDFASLLRSGHIIEKTKDTMHVEHVEWAEPLTQNTFIRHSAYVVTD